MLHLFKITAFTLLLTSSMVGFSSDDHHLIATLKDNKLYHLKTKFNATGISEELVVDTGSTGIIVSEKAYGKKFEKEKNCSQFGYSSSQRYYLGRIKNDSIILDDKLKIKDIPVFVAEFMCHGKIPEDKFASNASCQSNIDYKDAPSCKAANVLYIGIGFGRKESIHTTAPQGFPSYLNPSNPLLRTEVDGNRGYMLSADKSKLHIRVAVSEDNFEDLYKGDKYKDQKQHLQNPIVRKIDIPSKGFIPQTTMAFKIVSPSGKEVLTSVDLASDNQLPFLPDTGLNTAIVTFPFPSDECQGKACPSKEEVELARDIVVKHADCPASSNANKRFSNTFETNTVIELLDDNGNLYWPIVSGNQYRTSTGKNNTRIKSKYTSSSISSCSRYSYSHGKNASSKLNTGKSILNGCVWWFNASKNPSTSLSCAKPN